MAKSLDRKSEKVEKKDREKCAGEPEEKDEENTGKDNVHRKGKCAGETEEKDEENTGDDNVHRKQEEICPSSADLIEDKISKKGASDCKESGSFPCFKLAKPDSLEEFLNEKEKIVLPLPYSDNIPPSRSCDPNEKSGNFPASSDNVITLENKKKGKLELFKERFFRQNKSNACGLKNISKSETETSHRMMTLNFAEKSAGNSPGMKHSDLKEHLMSAMQKKKEEAFKKFKECDNIDNEIAPPSDEEFFEESSVGKCDSLRSDVEDICSTISSREFEENLNKPTSEKKRNVEADENETTSTSGEENKYEGASADSTKAELGSVKEFLDTDMVDAQLGEIEEETIKTHSDDVEAGEMGDSIERFCMASDKTVVEVSNSGVSAATVVENEENLVLPKNSETDSIDNQTDSDVIYCGFIPGNKCGKKYDAISYNSECRKKANNFKDSKVKEVDRTEECNVISENVRKHESDASPCHSNEISIICVKKPFGTGKVDEETFDTEKDYINAIEKKSDDPFSNGKHSEAKNAEKDVILQTASDSVESTYNFDLEYLTSSAIPSYQPYTVSSTYSNNVQTLDENSVEEVIQSSTNEMTENAENYNADNIGRCILDPRERGCFPFSFFQRYMQIPPRSHYFLESGLYISSIGNADEKLSAKESSSMCDLFASQEVNDFCSGPFITPLEEKNETFDTVLVRSSESEEESTEDNEAVLVRSYESEEERAEDNDAVLVRSSESEEERAEDDDIVLVRSSESEEERAVSSSPPYTVDSTLQSVDNSPPYRTGSPAVFSSSSSPCSEHSLVHSDECMIKESKFSGESEEEKSINSALPYGEEYKEGPIVHSEEEEEGKISPDEIGKAKPASCASLSDDEYNADDLSEEREMVFEKSIREYIDDEAILSGDDEDDDDEGDMEVDSDTEKGCGDDEAVANSEILRKQIAPMHMKQVLADDDRAVKFLQNKFLNEGELHSTGARNRKFVWKNNTSTLNENVCEESEGDFDDTEEPEATEMMRERLLHKEKTEPDNEENFFIGSNKYLNLSVLQNTASPSEVKPAAKRPRSSMLVNEDFDEKKLKRRKVEEATTSGTRAVKNCVFRANTKTTKKILDDAKIGAQKLDPKPGNKKFDPESGNQNLDGGESSDSSDTSFFNDLQ